MLALITNSILGVAAIAAGLAFGLAPIEPENAGPPDQTVAEMRMLAVPRLEDGLPVGALILKPTLAIEVSKQTGAPAAKGPIEVPSWFVAIKQDAYYRELFGTINQGTGPLDMPAIFQSLKAHVDARKTPIGGLTVTDLFVLQFDFFSMNELRTPIQMHTGS